MVISHSYVSLPEGTVPCHLPTLYTVRIWGYLTAKPSGVVPEALNLCCALYASNRYLDLFDFKGWEFGFAMQK